jgi:hypothetical protein
LAAAAVRDGLAGLRHAITVISENSLLSIPRKEGWREISIRENGMPGFSEGGKSAPLDYSFLLRPPNTVIGPSMIHDSFRSLVDYLVANTAYQDAHRHRFRPDTPEDELLAMVRLYAESIPVELVEQYQTVYPTEEFELERFLPLYLRWEEGVFADRVPIEVVIPLLMVRADFDEYRLGPNVVIRRMDDQFQRARAAKLHWAQHVHEWAAQAATHAIVVEGRTLSREQKLGLGGYPWELDDPEVYPISLVDRALAAIRIASGFNTGYAQVLIHYRYVHSDHADKFLPHLHGVPVRCYPVYFDHWGWLRPTPLMTAAHAELAAGLFGPLNQMPESDTLAIAARRINDCYLRDRHDDAILDAMIAFETLLSDDDHQGLTHKLALRVAALLKLEPHPPKPPAEAFREIKLIYDYRSKLVHGKSKAAGKIVKDHFGGDPSRPLAVALDYLRIVMRVLLQTELYRKPAEIDRHLLIGVGETEGASEDQ